MTDELAALKRAGRRHLLKLFAWVFGFFLLLGTLPLIFGLGFFGWELFRYERVSLYFANATEQVITVQINSGPRQEIDINEITSMDFSAPDGKITVWGVDGEVIEEVEVFTDNQDVFYNLNGERCYSVLDATRMYRGDDVADPVRMVEGIGRDDRFYHIPPGVFIRPRGVTSDQVPHGATVTWIDDVACMLLEDGNDHLLVGQQLIRMRARRERLEQMRTEQVRTNQERTNQERTNSQR